MTEPLAGIEKLETQAFAYVVFAAKVITWTALLALAGIVEFALVRKIYRAEFGKRKRSVARRHESATIGDMRDRYIKASELKSFSYCERAWRFEYEGAPSSLEPKRAEGRREHSEHSSRAVAARTGTYLGAVLLGLGIVGILISLALWALRK